MTSYSVLDLSPIIKGGSASDALNNSRDLAVHAERWGYKRFWLAEHHNMPGIASAATSIVIAHVAAATSTIRVGSGGVMLPNHAPLVIAEQFGTLDALFPGRIDLGLGRAPGSDQLTARALRRELGASDERFPEDVAELQQFLGEPHPLQRVRAVPGQNSNIPIWLLGSSLFSARLAAELGLPFAFASHFAPDALMQALHVYRTLFRPSAQLDKPYAMVGVNAFVADSDEEARYLFTSLQQQFLNLRRGTPGLLQPPVDTMDGRWSEMEQRGLEHTMQYAAVGSVDTVRTKLKGFIADTGADEVMLTAQIFDHAARLKSFELAAQVMKSL